MSVNINPACPECHQYKTRRGRNGRYWCTACGHKWGRSIHTDWPVCPQCGGPSKRRDCAWVCCDCGHRWHRPADPKPEGEDAAKASETTFFVGWTIVDTQAATFDHQKGAGCGLIRGCPVEALCAYMVNHLGGGALCEQYYICVAMRGQAMVRMRL
jgi:hypothetical protein